MYLKNTVTYLPVAKYKFVLQLKQDTIFPDFKGGVFRSGFSSALKKISCLRKKESCETCSQKSKCVYSLLFEAKINNKEYRVLGFAEPPRPFVLEPSLDEKKVYQAGDNFEIYILIFGNSIQFLPYLVLTFTELGKKGVGQTKAKYDLLSVETIDGKPIYDAHTQTFYNYDSTIKLSFDNIKEINEVKIKFLTPTRIKTIGESTKDVTFQTIIKSLLRRFSGLLLFYTDKKLECNFDEIINEAGKISIKFSDLKWAEIEKYLMLQNTVVKLRGIVGEVVYEGELTKFYPLLKIGEYIHIGRNTTFGLGKYEIVI